MKKPCTTWIIFCLLGVLSIPIMGCAGGSMAASTAPVTGSPSITWNPPATIQYGAPLSDVELNATASAPGNFVYSPTAGTVLQAGSQKLTVTFTPSGTVTNSPVTSNVMITVTPATPVITWAPLSPVQEGTALGAAQLNATANVAGTLSYSPALGTVLPAGTQQLTATFTPSDTIDYKPITAHNALTITAAAAIPSTPTISWSTPAPIQYGTALSYAQLDATASVPGNFIYSPAAGAVLQAGSQKLTVIFTPVDTTNYSPVTSTVLLTVTQAAPVVTWAPLSPIKQGTALGAAQLNATSNIPGSFSYSPAAGTVLPAGSQSLTVTFTPSNTTDYTSATALNALAVNTGSTAEPTTVNGVCGPANGANSSVAPSAGLCSAGTASAVTGTGPWTWQCTGSNSGTTSSCTVSPAPEAASTFVQSLGINTHLGFPSTVYYGHSQNVISALQYLGINTIRDEPPGYNHDPTTTAANDAVAAAGVQLDALLVGNGPVDITDTIAETAAFEQAYPGSIAAIEGPNEINAWPITYEGITDNYAAGVQVTQDLWTAVHSNPSLEAVPVYALTLSYGITGVAAGEEQLGDLAPYVTYGNAHIYDCCNVWQGNMLQWLPILKQDTPGMPMVITETGYTTTPSHVDELSAAKYNLNTLLENALNGIVRTYLYELVDENSSVTDTNVQDHFGEFHNDWTPKTGATAIHNLTTILKSAGSGTASTALNYSVSGLPTTGHSFLLGSSTAFDLAVWIDATVYDPTNAVDIAAPAYPVTINLGATFANVAVYDPMIGTTPIATYNNVSTLSISVIDHPLIVQVN